MGRCLGLVFGVGVGFSQWLVDVVMPVQENENIWNVVVLFILNMFT